MRTHLYLWSIVFICVNLFTVSIGYSGEGKKEVPLAVKGVLDLRAWNFEEDGPVELNGEYEFYWQQHLIPSDFMHEPPPANIAFIKVPGFWKGLNVRGQPLPGDGYATYRLKILLADQGLPLALKLFDFGTAFTLYVNGEKASMVGVPGQTAETTVPRYYTQVVEFTCEENQIEIVFQVSNFHHRRGGLWHVTEIGLERDIRTLTENRISFDLFLFGSILIMAFYHLGLFILRTKNRSPLYFSLFCLLIAIRIFTTGERYLTHLYPAINWELLLKLEYSWYLAVPVFGLFMQSLFQEFSKRFCQLIVILGVTFTLTVLLTPTRIFTHTLPAFQVITLVTIVYGFYVLVFASIHKREGALVFLVGFVVLGLTVANDMLHVATLVQTGFFVPFGLFIFIFAQAIMHSMRFSKAFTTVEAQYQELHRTYQAYRTEITGRLEAEDALRASEEKYRTILHSIEDGYYEVDLDGNLTFFNDALCKVLGYSREELAGMNNWQFMDEPTAKKTYHIFNEVYRSGKPAKAFEWETIRKDGTKSITEASVTLMHDSETRPIGFRGLARDITDLKEAEAQAKLHQQQLMQADKMVALGTLVSGVAHEINNPNNFIMLNAPILKEAWTDALPILEKYHAENGDFLVAGMPYSQLREKLSALLSGITDGTHRIKQIVDDLKNYIRDDRADFEQQVDINTVLRSTIALVANMIKKSTDHFEVAYCEDLPLLKGNFQRLEQVMINLIQNACQALPDTQKGILVTITCDHDGSSVIVKVQDEGIGIARDTLPHITDPFFTTKYDSGGVGLGLSISTVIIEKHGGAIHFASESGKGTTAEVRLPIDRNNMDKKG